MPFGALPCEAREFVVSVSDLCNLVPCLIANVASLQRGYPQVSAALSILSIHHLMKASI